jgi:subtilisin family serine protease
MAGGTAAYSARVVVTALMLAALLAGFAARAESAGAGARAQAAPELPGSGNPGTKPGKGKPKKGKVKKIGPSYVRQQWPLRAIRAKKLKLKAKRPLGEVIVATIDSGISLNHPDLRPILWRNPAPTPAPAPVSLRLVPAGATGWDMLDNDPHPFDIVGHGTAVGGLIAAEQSNGGIDGVAPNAKLMPMRACWRPFGGDLTCSDSASASAINWAAANGARVIHLSWTLGGGPLTSAAVAANPNVLFVANAGNGVGNDVDESKVNCTLPFSNLICVAGSTRSDAPTPCTSVGPISVDIAAPGIDVTTTGRFGRYLHHSPCAVSFAGPHVTGLAAILYGISPRSRAQGIKAAILDSAYPGFGFEGKTVTGGIIDVPRAMTLLKRRTGAF